MIRPLSVASRGHLRSGDTPALTIAVRGFLDGAAIIPPIPEQRPPGGGSDDKRRRDLDRRRKLEQKRKAKIRIKALKQAAKAARKADDAKAAEKAIEEVRAEALALAKAEDFKLQRLEAANSIKEVLDAVSDLNRQINSQIGVIQAAEGKADADYRKAREQAMADEQQRKAEHLKAIVANEEDRQAAMRAENEDIAIALLLIA